MILRIEIENFRGRLARTVVDCGSAQTIGGSVVWINGGAGAGKTTMVEALLLFQCIARGMTRTDQYSKGDGFAISANPSCPVDLIIEFAKGGMHYTYGLRLEYEGVRHWQVENEWININGGLIFARTGNHVEIGGVTGGISYELDRSVFVLSTFATQDANHPVARTREYLAGLFLLVPTPTLFSDEIVSAAPQSFLDPYGRNIGAWMVAFFGVNMSSYTWFTELLARHLPGFCGMKTVSLAAGRSRVHLTMRHRDGHLCETPLSMISYRQKLIFLGCLLMTVRRVFPNLLCVWDDFDQLAEVSSGFASELCGLFLQHGQLVFSSARDFGLRTVRRQEI